MSHLCGFVLRVPECLFIVDCGLLAACYDWGSSKQECKATCSSLVNHSYIYIYTCDYISMYALQTLHLVTQAATPMKRMGLTCRPFLADVAFTVGLNSLLFLGPIVQRCYDQSNDPGTQENRLQSIRSLFVGLPTLVVCQGGERLVFGRVHA